MKEWPTDKQGKEEEQERGVASSYHTPTFQHLYSFVSASVGGVAVLNRWAMYSAEQVCFVLVMYKEVLWLNSPAPRFHFTPTFTVRSLSFSDNRLLPLLLHLLRIFFPLC